MANIYIGTSGWSYQHWNGNFYPADLPQKKYFSYYCQYFNSVEINATFYRRFKETTYLNWKEQAPDNFKYVLKAPKLITHMRRLKNCSREIKEFCNSASLLKEKLGLILLQLPPGLNYDLILLKEVLNQFEEPYKIAVEFRNATWTRQETSSLLNGFKAVYCIVDSPKSDDLLNYQEAVASKKLDNTRISDSSAFYPTSSPAAYIRLHGRTNWYDYNYSEHELNDTARVIDYISQKGKKDIYIFFNNDSNAYAVYNGLYLKKLIAHIENKK